MGIRKNFRANRKINYRIQLDDGRIWKRHINQIPAIGEKTPEKITDNIIFDNNPIVDNTEPEAQRPLQQAPEKSEHLQQEWHQQTTPAETSNKSQSNLVNRAIKPIMETPKQVPRSPRSRRLPSRFKDYEVQINIYIYSLHTFRYINTFDIILFSFD